MERHCATSLLFALLGIGCAHAKAVDRLTDAFFDRMLMRAPQRMLDMDRAALSKPGQSSVSSRMGLRPVLPAFAPRAMRPGDVAPQFLAGMAVLGHRPSKSEAASPQLISYRAQRPQAHSMTNQAPASATAASVASGLAFEDVATFPRPGTTGPGMLAFAPGGGAVTYLISPEGELRRELRAMDIATGVVSEVCKPPSDSGEEKDLSLEEKLQRERTRNVFTGIMTYMWAEEGNIMLVPLAGELYVQHGLEGELRRVCGPSDLEGASGPLLDPRLSPDGSLVAFVCDREVYIAPTDGSKPPTQLTFGARGTALTNGLADYVAQEEMERMEGYWISPNGDRVAFTEVNESHIPVYRIVHQGSDAVGDGAQEDHRYPFAGAANPKVRLGVVATSGSGTVTWFDGLTERLGDDGYLARIAWLPDGTIAAQVTDRLQQKLELLRLDPKDGSVKTLVCEETGVWINLHKMFKPLKKEHKFLWASERSGFQHLYLYDLDGGMLQQLTQGDWLVESIAHVDEERGLVYFTGNRGTWLEKHLFVVPLAGGEEPRQLTTTPGMHMASVDKEKGYFADTWSNLTEPLRVQIRSLEDGALVREVYSSQDPRLEHMRLSQWELSTLPSTDGKVTLQAAILKPDPAKHGAGPYPTVVSVYGGPHVQTIANNWPVTVTMREQLLRERGYLVLKVDNRGSSRRGLAFEGAVKHDLGNLEVADQVAGVKHCVSLGLTDPDRVGIMGWSYGGYMSAMALVKEPTVFRAAVSGAPVTHWDGYDTHYTERYMGTPQTNPDGYKRSTVMPYVGNITDDNHLLLVHGLIDENVHFRHAARLINALIKARKRYDLLLFPDERHLPRSLQDRVYMEEQIFAFFQRNLAATAADKL